MNVYEEVLAFAAVKHKGQKRRDGSPYINHPLAVAGLVNKSEYDKKEKHIAAALLHDVLEDTDATEEELKKIVTDDVIKAVRILTRGKGQDEAEYVHNILQDHIASVVKSCDKIHNLWDCVYAGEPGKTRNSRDKKFAERYIDKAKKYYYGKFSYALDRQIEMSEYLLENPVVQSRNPLPAGTVLTLYADEEREDYEAALKSYNDLKRQPDLDSTDLVFYDVNGLLYCDDGGSAESAGEKEMWELTDIGWEPVVLDVWGFGEDVFVLNHMGREAAIDWVKSYINYKTEQGFFYDFVKRRLI